MADSKIKDLTEKVTGAATDEFVINDVAGGNADNKMGMDGLRITESQITDLGTYLTDITGEASTSLTDTANITYLDGTQTNTGAKTYNSATFILAPSNLPWIDMYAAGGDTEKNGSRGPLQTPCGIWASG